MKWNETTIGFIAVLFIFFGFGMIMGGNAMDLMGIAHTGSVLLGIGALYLIYILYKSMKNDNTQNGPTGQGS